MPDPSLLVSVPSLHEPSLAPPAPHASTCSSPCRTSTAGRLDRERAGPAATTSPPPRAPRLPDDIEVEELVDPLDWEAQGMERGTPFALPTASSRPARSGRPTSTGGRPGLVFVGSGTVPGVGVPMVLVSGRLAAERVERGGRR